MLSSQRAFDMRYGVAYSSPMEEAIFKPLEDGLDKWISTRYRPWKLSLAARGRFRGRDNRDPEM